jgi:hypothetical protein
MICELLGKAEWGALSLCCRTLFVLVHTGAPFRVIRIQKERKSRLPALQAMRRPLLSAVEIGWELPLNKSTWFGSQNTSTIVSAEAKAFRYFLSVLSQSSNLRQLSLSGVDVSIPHQEVILALHWSILRSPGRTSPLEFQRTHHAPPSSGWN